jgi:hypothetical protein
MSRSTLVSAIFASVVLACAGCATVFSGTKQEVGINSNPQRATYRVFTAGGALGSTKGQEVANGRTPDVVELSRKNDYIVKVKVDGYREATVKINQDFNYWVICSAACGVIGVGIDALSGAFWKLDQDKVAITLEPASRVPANSAPAKPDQPPPPPPASAGDPTVENEQPAEERLYLTVYRRDDDGRLRHIAVPLVPEES